jgi:glycosyltransferase involved in cell wall biosynthesis
MLLSTLFLFSSFLLLELLAVLSFYWKPPKKGYRFSLSELSLLIPFKNEQNNLDELLNWLMQQPELPKQVIFINDHSTDSSCSIFDKYNSLGIELIHLPNELKGKKQAIRFGIEQSKGTFILTFDADVVPVDNYFQLLEDLAISQLNILPVVMKPKDRSFAARASSIEYNMLQSVNYLFSNMMVLTASGANLLFEKSIFDKVDDIVKHQHINSGDDHYLLRAFQANKIPANVLSLDAPAVFTFSISDWKSYFYQRSRWLGKLIHFSSFRDWIAGVFMLIFFFGTYSLLLWSLYQLNYQFFSLFFLANILLYLIPIAFFNNRLTLSFIIYSFFMPILYPIIFTLVLLFTPFLKNKNWKQT